MNKQVGAPAQNRVYMLEWCLSDSCVNVGVKQMQRSHHVSSFLGNTVEMLADSLVS